jgi:hypothetical protein
MFLIAFGIVLLVMEQQRGVLLYYSSSSQRSSIGGNGGTMFRSVAVSSSYESDSTLPFGCSWR